jgi:hypothetical protein
LLFVHEVHDVVGAREEEFEAAYRKELMPALAEGDDARLLWYLRQAHGTGPAYRVVTVTAVPGGGSLERLDLRMLDGDLAEWAERVDSMRHDSRAKVLVPLGWSPLKELDLRGVPADGAEHEPVLYMEDTAWPFRGRFVDYLELAGSLYMRTLERSRAAGRGILEMEASFRPAYGTAGRREVVLWQRVSSEAALMRLLSTETPPDYKVPGTWMHDALEVRDRWESRLLRTAGWSPRR